MRRGDVVIVSAPGEYDKPRPAVVVQSNLFNAAHPSIAVCLISSDIADTPLVRLTVEPTGENGLKSRSQIMVDKIVALRRQRVSKVAGTLDEDTLLRLNRSLAIILGLAD